MDLGDDAGLRQIEEIGIPLDVPRMAGEAIAAILLLGEASLVDEHAPRSVQHEDPLGEKLVEVSPDVLHEFGSA